MLTSYQIKKLSTEEEVDENAVKNFLQSLQDGDMETKEDAMSCLEYDTYIYRWGIYTYDAIRDGIELYFAENPIVPPSDGDCLK